MVTATTPNEKLIIDFYQAMGSNDLEKLRSFLHPDATWRLMSVAGPNAGTQITGQNSIIDDFVGPVRRLFEGLGPQVEVNTLISSGSQVAAEIKGWGRFNTGADYSNLYAWFFDIKDDLVFAVRQYTDTYYLSTLTEHFAPDAA